jgi:hypothetical protein
MDQHEQERWQEHYRNLPTDSLLAEWKQKAEYDWQETDSDRRLRFAFVRQEMDRRAEEISARIDVKCPCVDSAHYAELSDPRTGLYGQVVDDFVERDGQLYSERAKEPVQPGWGRYWLYIAGVGDDDYEEGFDTLQEAVGAFSLFCDQKN